MDAKETIKQVLDFLKYKVDNDMCTMEELRSVSDVLQNSLNVIGTVEDFAKFCDQPESSVRNVISRRVIDKPKRRVFYRFFPFIKSVPSKWLTKKQMK